MQSPIFRRRSDSGMQPGAAPPRLPVTLMKGVTSATAKPSRIALWQAWACCTAAWALTLIGWAIVPNPLPICAPKSIALAILATGSGALGMGFASRTLSQTVERVLRGMAAAAVFFAPLPLLHNPPNLGPVGLIIGFIGYLTLCYFLVLPIGTFCWMVHCLASAFFPHSRLREKMSGKELVSSLIVTVLCQLAIDFGLLSALVFSWLRD